MTIRNRIFLGIFLLLLLPPASRAQSKGIPAITKIDPPNWWTQMPSPMLLLNGEGFSNTRFTLSDPHLRIVKHTISANGHWAELWLNASPDSPKTVTIHARNASGEATATYRFERRRPATDGFAGFSSTDAMYLIMTDRFADGDSSNDGPEATQPETSPAAADERAKIRGWHGGDLRGILQNLDYIQQLGLTTVWITPVYANLHESDSYHGYGATDMYAVDPHYGTLSDLKALAAELHRRRMKLVLDTVPNHVGQAHPWADDEPDPQWLHGTKGDHPFSEGDFASLINPHTPWRDQRPVVEGWFANTLPDLNQENQATAQYLTQNALWWIEETSADGLRIDTFPYVGRAFWQSFHTALHSTYPRLTTVGEIFNCDATVTSWFAGGASHNGVDSGLDTPFDFPSYCALRDVFLKNAPMQRLADVWRMDSLYPHPERLIPFLGNHDTSRFLWNEGASPQTTRMAFTILLTMRGLPQIYSGDEIALAGGEDPDNRRDFPGGWPEHPQSAFTSRTPEQSAMHDWVAQLLHLRGNYPAFQTGDMQVLLAEKDLLAYARIDHGKPGKPGQKVLVVVNRAATPAKLRLKLARTALDGPSQLQTIFGTAACHLEGDDLLVDMPAISAWIATIR